MKKTALLVTDVQNAIVLSKTPELYAREAVITNIAGLIDNARALKAPVIYIRHEDKSGSKFEYGTEGWKIYDGVAPKNGEVIVGRWSADAFKDTMLIGELQKKNIKRLIIVGFQTDNCVNATVKSAVKLGFEIVVVSDAHSTFDRLIIKAPSIIARCNAAWGKSYAKVLTTSEIQF